MVIENGFSFNPKQVHRHGDLMDNLVALFEDMLRYSSLEVNGGFGSTNNSFCCFASSETGIILMFGTLPNMNVNTHAAE